MSLIASDKLAIIQNALKKGASSQRKFHIQTFGCQMNHADSEKIHMLLTQAGLAKVDTWEEADIVIFNTCSVRQKGEDRVFGFVEEIDRLRHSTGRDIRVGLTGCMTRKTGLNKKYYDYQGRKNTTKIELLELQEGQSTKYKGQSDGISLFNSDDELFNRTDNIDFVVRIEEIGALTTLLSIMYGEDMGQDDAFQSYLRVRQE